MIEVGRHKIHFFDDTMMSGGVSSLEDTVHTDFERTMMAAHVDAPEAQVARGARDEDLSRTTAIARDPTLRLPDAEGVAAPMPAGAAGIALRVVTGARKGALVTLDRANTMIGAAGGDTALVVRRGNGFYLARFGGSRAPRLNHAQLGPGAHPIGLHDEIEVGSSTFQVIQLAD
jgi:hypothetical protein